MYGSFPPKKMQLKFGLLHKGGGGAVPKQTKSFGTLFVNHFFWNFWEKGGGLTKSKSFGTLFCQNIG